VVEPTDGTVINQRLLARQLSRAGCTVTTADDGQYAIDTLLTAAKDGTGFDVCGVCGVLHHLTAA
jgi:CheY-like chemotaxis protein